MNEIKICLSLGDSLALWLIVGGVWCVAGQVAITGLAIARAIRIRP